MAPLSNTFTDCHTRLENKCRNNKLGQVGQVGNGFMMDLSYCSGYFMIDPSGLPPYRSKWTKSSLERFRVDCVVLLIGPSSVIEQPAHSAWLKGLVHVLSAVDCDVGSGNKCSFVRRQICNQACHFFRLS